jgi:hypothetical protein
MRAPFRVNVQLVMFRVPVLIAIPPPKSPAKFDINVQSVIVAMLPVPME